MANFKDVEVFGLKAKVTNSRVYYYTNDFKYRYAIRHSDYSWVDPITIEKSVVVNFYGSIFFKEELVFENSDDAYIELSEDDIYNIIQALD